MPGKTFTRSAHQVLNRALASTGTSGHMVTEGQFILAVLQESACARLLVERLPVDMSEFEQTVRARDSEPVPETSNNKIAREVRRAIEIAAREAEARAHERLGTPHLLFGLLTKEGSLLARALTELGTDTNEARNLVAGCMQAPED